MPLRQDGRGGKRGGCCHRPVNFVSFIHLEDRNDNYISVVEPLNYMVSPAFTLKLNGCDDVQIFSFQPAL